MNNCKCNPTFEPYEFEIESENKNIFNNRFDKLFPIITDQSDFKDKLICEYLQILDKLECGEHIDLEPFLEDLSKVYIENVIRNEEKNENVPPVIYYGFDLSETPDNVNFDLLNKRFQNTMEFTDKIENTQYGSYLWIISSHTLDKVATDEGFTFQVKMNPMGYYNDMHYYRSNSQIDICNLTYYIK